MLVRKLRIYAMLMRLEELEAERLQKFTDHLAKISKPMNISEIPRIEEITYTKEQIMQLPQKVKHRKKRKYHD